MKSKQHKQYNNQYKNEVQEPQPSVAERRSAPTVAQKCAMWLAIGAFAAFAVFVYVLLVVDYTDYMHKIAELSFFVPGSQFFDECMRTPGGFVMWLSTLATTSFSVPELGAAVYALMCALLSWLTAKATRQPWPVAAICVIPAAMALLAMLDFGYVIYSLKSPGFAFVPLVGMILAVVAFWCYNALGRWYFKVAVMAILVTVGYQFLGFYALLTAVMAAISDVMLIVCKRDWLCVISVCIGVIGVWLIPDAYFVYFANDLTEGFAYLAPLPRFYVGEEAMWLPYNVMALSLGVLALTRSLWPAKARLGALWSVAAMCVYVAAIVLIVVSRNTDKNFDLTLALDRALYDGDYDRAASLFAEFKDEPTRLNAMLAQAAVVRTGDAASRIFRQGYGMQPCMSTRADRLIYEAGTPIIPYTLGLNNLAYRMAMEYKVEFGMNVAQLKIMAKCALINNEGRLARKLLETLAKVPFQREWANRYLRYVDNKDKISDDELAGTMALKLATNTPIDDNGDMEKYIWRCIGAREATNDAQLDEAMIGALMNQDLDTFITLARSYVQKHKSLPLHYQEGVMAWSLANGKDPGYSDFDISPSVLSRYNDFVNLLESKKMSDDALHMAVYSQFRDTYWYYFMFRSRL